MSEQSPSSPRSDQVSHQDSDLDDWRVVAEQSKDWHPKLRQRVEEHLRRVGMAHLIEGGLQENPHIETARREIADALATLADQNGQVIPFITKETQEYLRSSELVPEDILIDYARFLKRTSEFSEDQTPAYWIKLDQLLEMDTKNLDVLYRSEVQDNPLHGMLQHELAINNTSSIRSATDIIKKHYDVTYITQLFEMDAVQQDPNIQALLASLGSGDVKLWVLYGVEARTRAYEPLLARGTQENRKAMRAMMAAATGVSLELADSYTYQASRATMGEYMLDDIADRVRTFGPEKLSAVFEFSGISALSGYSEDQLERMYRLAINDKEEIERLRSHDIIAMFINMEGDHNGVSSEVAARMDDAAERIVFFELSEPQEIYLRMKQLSELGIAPSTLIFAAHGSAGQFHIGKRPALDSDQPVNYITTIYETWFIEDRIAAIREEMGKDSYVFSIDKANGLIRAIERFMSPSRSVDDPDQDSGRKKIISLSCEFAGETPQRIRGDQGEALQGEKTSLLRKLGEVIAAKLPDEHIDIYGADISTNRQTRTDGGFYYNQFDKNTSAGIVPHAASVLHVDGQILSASTVDEVKLRKDGLVY